MSQSTEEKVQSSYSDISNPENVQSEDKMRAILFAPATYNLAETTRCIELAKSLRQTFDVHFTSFGGSYSHLITDSGFTIHAMEPKLTPKKEDHIYKVDQGEKIGRIFSVNEIREQVKSEISLYQALRPVAVVTGFDFSCNVSCKVTGVPLIWLTHSTWLMRDLLKKRLLEYPDMLDKPVLRWLPDRFLSWLGLKTVFLLTWARKPYKQVAKDYDVKITTDFPECVTGDYNLLAEPESFCEVDPPPSHHYIAPLIGRLEGDVPENLKSMPRDLPIVYFAMGSSGRPEVVRKILRDFRNKPVRVIAPVKKLLEKTKPIEVPKNVYVTDWLPAHLVNPMADISVIHGGIGTVMTACMAGKPIVGVGMMIEQEANLDCLVRKGFAIRIRLSRLSSETLFEAISKLLLDDEAKEKARHFGEVVRACNNPNVTKAFFEKTFLHDHK